MNSPQFVGRNLTSVVEQWTRSSRSSDSNIEQVFVGILARRPTSNELQYVQQQLTSADAEATVVYRRLAWALLMSSEFSLNH